MAMLNYQRVNHIKPLYNQPQTDRGRWVSTPRKPRIRTQRFQLAPRLRQGGAQGAVGRLGVDGVETGTWMGILWDLMGF